MRKQRSFLQKQKAFESMPWVHPGWWPASPFLWRTYQSKLRILLSQIEIFGFTFSWERERERERERELDLLAKKKHQWGCDWWRWTLFLDFYRFPIYLVSIPQRHLTSSNLIPSSRWSQCTTSSLALTWTREILWWRPAWEEPTSAIASTGALAVPNQMGEKAGGGSLPLGLLMSNQKITLDMTSNHCRPNSLFTRRGVPPHDLAPKRKISKIPRFPIFSV